MDVFKIMGTIALNGGAEVKEELNDVSADAENVAGNIGKALSNLGGMMTEAGAKLAPVSAAMGALAGASVKTSASFEDGMLKVQSLTGATEEDMARLTQTAKDYGATTAWSARDVADAMGYMALAGFDANEIIASTGGMLSLASASGENLSTVTDILTTAQKTLADTQTCLQRFRHVRTQPSECLAKRSSMPHRLLVRTATRWKKWQPVWA